MPVVALFAMGQKRIYAVLYDVVWLVIVAVLILPQRTPFVRNVVNSRSQVPRKHLLSTVGEPD